MTTAKPAAVPEQKPEPSAEDLQALQDAIDSAVAEAVAKALAEQKASTASQAPSADAVVSVVDGPLGRHFLSEKDFVPIWDKDGNPLPAVPKHWGTDQLPLGATKKKPAEKSDKD